MLLMLLLMLLLKHLTMLLLLLLLWRLIHTSCIWHTQLQQIVSFLQREEFFKFPHRNNNAAVVCVKSSLCEWTLSRRSVVCKTKSKNWLFNLSLGGCSDLKSTFNKQSWFAKCYLNDVWTFKHSALWGIGMHL